MSHDEIPAAYERIAGRFPAEWPVEIMATAHVGRRKSWRTLAPMMRAISTLDYSLHVTAGGVDYVEIDVDLDEIEAAAQAIIEKITAADMADPAKSRKGLDRLAEAVESDATVDNAIKTFHDNAMAATARALQRTALAPALSPASDGSGRAACRKRGFKAHHRTERFYVV